MLSCLVGQLLSDYTPKRRWVSYMNRPPVMCYSHYREKYKTAAIKPRTKIITINPIISLATARTGNDL